MRLANFMLERYGPFEQLDLPFDPAPGRVNLIVAPNGFGKSVIRRSIGEFLFGIDSRTPMTYRFGTERMLLRAEVLDGNTKHSLVRRKGNGNTLACANGAEVLADEARRLFGGADKSVFQELFGLDTSLLRSGGEDLIRSHGRLGQVLFAAGGGMGRVRELIAQLERKRDELGKPARHKSRPLWSALGQWEQGSADLKRSALRPDGWNTLERVARDAAAHLETLLQEQAADAAERDRLRTNSACRPWLDRLHAAQQTLGEAMDAPELDENFEKRWRDALENAVRSASAANAARTELQLAQEARAALRFDPVWIAAEAQIKALADLRGLALGAEGDLPMVQREAASDRAKATVLRRDLGWADDVPLPPGPVVKEAQRRLQQHPKLAAEATAAQDRLLEADRHLAATTAELESLPVGDDTAAVADLTASLRAHGDPAARLDTGRRKLRTAEAALRTSLGAIPDCPLAEAALKSTAAPSEARLEEAGKALSRAETAYDRVQQTQAERSAAVEAERAGLAALERTGMLPPADALPGARAHRDALWAAMCAAERPDPTAILAVDRAMREADDIADALIAHGQEVAEATAMRGRLAALEAEQAKDREAVSKAAGDVAAARGELLAIARAAGGHAEDVATLRAFLRARDAAVVCRDARDAVAAELADTEAELTAVGGQLAGVMGIPTPELSALPALLAEADRRIEAARHLAAHRGGLTAQAVKQRAARATAVTGASKAERALAEWVEQWRPIAAALARPAAETWTTTADALARIEELRNTEHKVADAQRRIDDMQAAIALLGQRIGQLGELSAELAALPPIDAAEAFQRRLQAEHREAARCADADRRIEQAASKLAQHVADAERAGHALGGLRAALRAATDDDAERQLQRIRAVTAARGDGAEALRQLAVQGGGLSVETLTARAAETSAEADALRISELSTRLQARSPLIEAARDASNAAAASLEGAGSGSDASEAAQRREAAQAMLARTAEEALLLHATYALLQAALDRQAAGVQQPLLVRIGEVFRIITGGAQAGVRIEETRDGQTMVALEADGIARKSLDQLSEGTCDQLYLALRIAALEDYAKTTLPLPFIADDVLQTFDDPRTTATLQALLELSRLVQVIVLTHHHHVGDLAERFGNGDVQVMRLSDLRKEAA